MKLLFEHWISYYNENQMFYQEGVAVISKKYKYTDSINIRNSLWNTLLSFINYWWYRKFGQNRAIILNFDIIEFVTENTHQKTTLIKTTSKLKIGYFQLCSSVFNLGMIPRAYPRLVFCNLASCSNMTIYLSISSHIIWLYFI